VQADPAEFASESNDTVLSALHEYAREHGTFSLEDFEAPLPPGLRGEIHEAIGLCTRLPKLSMYQAAKEVSVCIKELRRRRAKRCSDVWS